MLLALRAGLHASAAERLPRSSLALCPPETDALAAVARPTAKQFFFALGWLCPLDGNYLPNAAFTTAMRRRLGLPVHGAGLHCAYTTLTGSQSCGVLLDRHGHHAAACARSEGSKPVRIRTYLHERPQKAKSDMYKFAPRNPRL